MTREYGVVVYPYLEDERKGKRKRLDTRSVFARFISSREIYIIWRDLQAAKAR